MAANGKPYGEVDRIDVNDAAMVAYWAEKWGGVKPLAIYDAVRKVGPLVRDVTVEIWKEV